MMEKKPVNIDFSKIGEGIMRHVREKAVAAGSKIVYGEDGFIIEEDPKTGEKIKLRPSCRK